MAFQKAFGVHFTYLLHKSLGKQVLPKKEGYRSSYAFQEALLNHPPCWGLIWDLSPRIPLAHDSDALEEAKRTDSSLLFHYFPTVNNTQVYTEHTPQRCFFCLFVSYFFVQSYRLNSPLTHLRAHASKFPRRQERREVFRAAPGRRTHRERSCPSESAPFPPGGGSGPPDHASQQPGT